MSDNPMVETELKPCPFCGAPADLKPVETYPNGEKSPAYARCSKCHVYLHGYDNAKVVAAWNARPGEDVARERLQDYPRALAELNQKIAECEKWKADWLCADKELTDLRAACAWVPCSEKQPDDQRQVLCIGVSSMTGRTLFEVGRFDVQLKTWMTGIIVPAYWCELPIPPAPEPTK